MGNWARRMLNGVVAAESQVPLVELAAEKVPRPVGDQVAGLIAIEARKRGNFQPDFKGGKR